MYQLYIFYSDILTGDILFQGLNQFKYSNVFNINLRLTRKLCFLSRNHGDYSRSASNMTPEQFENYIPFRKKNGTTYLKNATKTAG